MATSPVREALLSLVDQGVMEAVRNRGYRVQPLGERDRQEIYEMRALLEIPTMVSLAGNPEVGTRQAEFRAIADDIVRAAQDGDVVAYLESDLRFHLGLLGILGNERLVAAVKLLRDHTRQLRLTTMIGTETLTRTAESHLDILQGLLAGDADRVRHLMVEHLEHIRNDWGPADIAAPTTISVVG